MAQIYVDEATKENLDDLARLEHRAITDEVRFLVDNRVKELEKNCRLAERTEK
jgi:hypothetical protein